MISDIISCLEPDGNARREQRGNKKARRGYSRGFFIIKMFLAGKYRSFADLAHNLIEFLGHARKVLHRGR